MTPSEQLNGLTHKRPLPNRVELNYGIGNLIYDTLCEHGGKMLMHDLLQALLEKGLIACEFMSKTFNIKFCVGPNLLPIMQVFPDGEGIGWNLELEGPTSLGFKKIFEKFNEKGVLEAKPGNQIRGYVPRNLILRRTSTVDEINDTLGRRAFDLEHDSKAVKRTHI
jgi:hypothetical protein